MRRPPERSKPAPPPTIPDPPPDPDWITARDFADAVLMAVIIFTILYLGSLAQRMGAV